MDAYLLILISPARSLPPSLPPLPPSLPPPSTIPRYGQICVDHQLKVFDLRALRPLSPLTVASIQPMLLRCMPAFPSTVLLLSQLGEFQFLDLRGLVTPTNIMMHHLSTTAEGTVACCLDVAPSLRCLAFGDSCGGYGLGWLWVELGWVWVELGCGVAWIGCEWAEPGC